jgi:hypothetical protein
MSDAPKQIWLQDDGDYTGSCAAGELSWCQDKINDDDTGYIRADIVAAKNARIVELENAISLFIKYDAGDMSAESGIAIILNYNAAIEAAKAAMASK